MSVADGIADAVVVGGGTVGAWCAYFLRRAGAGAQVVLIEKGFLRAEGASSLGGPRRPDAGRDRPRR